MHIDTTALDERIISVLEKTGKSDLIGHAANLAAALVGRDRNVSVHAKLGQGRVPVILAAASQWLLSRPGGKALILAAGEQDVAAVYGQLDAFARSAGFSGAAVGRDADPGVSAADAALGSLQTLVSRSDAGTLELASYGLFVVLDLHALVDPQWSALLKAIESRLMPDGDRRTLVVSDSSGAEELYLARAMASSPEELCLEQADELAKAAPSVTYYVDAADKARLALGLLGRDASRPVAVFCNLRGTAEDAASRFRANGYTVEYIAGDLPRKAAILESVRAGRFGILVLTDEGAAGLPGAWASRLYNWDIPLEGEAYVRRLAALDTATPGAAVVNLACDRYAVGLPAIERYLGASLAATQADASLYAAEDKGADPKPSRGRNDDGSRRGGRSDGAAPDRERGQGNGQQAGSQAAPRRDGPGQRRRGEADTRRDDGGRYDGKNAKSIQADIAALTGGRLDRLPARDPAPGKGGRQMADGGAGGPARLKPAGGRRGGRRSRKQEQGAQVGSDGQKPSGDGRSRPEPRRGGSGGAREQAPKAKSPAGRMSDPYAVSMEERMKLYRERYGSSLARPAGKDGSPGKRGRRRGASDERLPQPQAPANPGQRAERPVQSQQSGTGEEKQPKKASGGIFGAIRDLFTKGDAE